MRHAVLASLATLLVSLAPASVGGAERGSVPQAVLEQLDFMVGNWQEVAEGEGAAEQILVHRREWLPGKHGLLVTWGGIFDGVKVDASGIVGYDSTTNCVTEHWFLTDGTYMETRYPVDQMTDRIWEGTTLWAEYGKKAIGTCRLEKQGDDLYVWTANMKLDGKEQPPYKAVTRRLPDGQPTMLKEYAEAMLGEWECKECTPWGSTPGSDKVMARGSCSWAVPDAALRWDLQIGEGKAQSLLCWDPVSKQLKELGVGSDGAQFDLQIVKTAAGWSHQGKLTLPNGEQQDIQMVTSFVDGDTHVNAYDTHKEAFVRVKR